LAESCRQAKKSSIIFVDNIKRLQRRRPSTIDILALSTSSNERLQISYHLPLPPPIRKSCGLDNGPCRVVNMKHIVSLASLLSPRVSPELFSTAASYPEIPCTRPISKGFLGADLSGCIADRILLAYHSLMCRKLFLLPLIASVRFMHPRKVSSRNLITQRHPAHSWKADPDLHTCGPWIGEFPTRPICSN
jgi:hypothetical protein